MAQVSGDNHLRTYDVLGRYNYIIGDAEQSDYYFGIFIDKHPRKSEAIRTTGRFLYKQGQFEKALDLFDESIRLNPKKSLTWLQKGWALRALNKNREAIECFQRAYDISKGKLFYSLQGMAESNFFMGQKNITRKYLPEMYKLIENKVYQRNYSRMQAILNSSEGDLSNMSMLWNVGPYWGGSLSDTIQGILVTAVDTGTIANSLGVLPGDIITHLNDTPHFNSHIFFEDYAAKSYGENIELTISRSGSIKKLSGKIEYFYPESRVVSTSGVHIIYDGSPYFSGNTVIKERNKNLINIIVPYVISRDAKDISVLMSSKGTTSVLPISNTKMFAENNFACHTIDISHVKSGDNQLSISCDNGNLPKPLTFLIRSNNGPSQRLAILLGVTEYNFRSSWSAEAVIADMANMEDALKKHNFIVKKIFNPTALTLNNLMSSLIINEPIKYDDGNKRQRIEDSDLIIYYTGHGARAPGAAKNAYGFLVPSGGSEVSSAGWYSMLNITTALQNDNLAKHKIFILDSCYAASASVNKDISGLSDTCSPELNDVPSFHLFAASQEGEMSWIGPNKQSLFTSALADILRGKYDDDGCISIAEIQSQLEDLFVNGNQTPEIVPISGRFSGPSFQIN